MAGDKNVWLIWSSAFLIPWFALYFLFPGNRKIMGWASILTAPFGLTEPVFVPAYWNPPSLFNLAARSGFDIESLIFSFAIGGIGFSLYNIVTNSAFGPMGKLEILHGHRYHGVVLLIPVLTFALFWLFPINPIYVAIGALLSGAGGISLCRPDLARNIFIGGILFFFFYLIFLFGLEWSAPGYIARVWNLPALSGIMFGRLPLEELLFGFSFGAYWSGVYEHVTWQRSVVRSRPPASENISHS